MTDEPEQDKEQEPPDADGNPLTKPKEVFNNLLDVKLWPPQISASGGWLDRGGGSVAIMIILILCTLIVVAAAFGWLPGEH